LKAGQYLCDEVGTRITSLIGYSTVYDNTDGIHPTRGQRLVFSQDVAGLGGDVKYARVRGDATKYKNLGGGWIFSAHAEGGYIRPLQSSPGPGRDAIRLTDRFFGPQLRGFDIRGIGPRVQRVPYNADGTLANDQARITDALGGRTYYMGRLELEFPTGPALRSAGLRPSIYADAGSLYNITPPALTNVLNSCTPKVGKTVPSKLQHPGDPACSATDYDIAPGFKEFFLGNSGKPRVSVGIGVNWVSPFGPLRLDLAKALIKQKGDDTKLFQFNVGTQF
jgi:outer membrane protein insertion porin family